MKNLTTVIDILLIEDNEPDTILVKRSLDKSGLNFKLKVLEDGEEALDYLMNLSSKLPDLILLDINLPKINGFEILAEAITDKRFDKIPVIVLTTSESTRLKNFSEGFNVAAYNVKPLDIDLLKQVYENSLTF